jgi:hypothetical protein
VLLSSNKVMGFQQSEQAPTTILRIRRLGIATRGTVPPRSMSSIRMERSTGTRDVIAGRAVTVQDNPANLSNKSFCWISSIFLSITLNLSSRSSSILRTHQFPIQPSTLMNNQLSKNQSSKNLRRRFTLKRLNPKRWRPTF